MLYIFVVNDVEYVDLSLMHQIPDGTNLNIYEPGYNISRTSYEKVTFVYDFNLRCFSHSIVVSDRPICQFGITITSVQKQI